MTNNVCAGDCVCDQRKVSPTQPSFALELCNQIDKTTPMKTSTDEQNNTNKNINRSTKQHQQIDKTTPTNRQINTNKNINRQTMVLLVLLCLSVDGFIGVALSVC
jgi:hypothetical protein